MHEAGKGKHAAQPCYKTRSRGRNIAVELQFNVHLQLYQEPPVLRQPQGGEFGELPKKRRQVCLRLIGRGVHCETNSDFVHVRPNGCAPEYPEARVIVCRSCGPD
jgi:hypothetical protein